MERKERDSCLRVAFKNLDVQVTSFIVSRVHATHPSLSDLSPLTVIPPSLPLLLSLLGLHEFGQSAELEDLGLVNIKRRKV